MICRLFIGAKNSNLHYLKCQNENTFRISSLEISIKILLTRDIINAFNRRRFSEKNVNIGFKN